MLERKVVILVATAIKYSSNMAGCAIFEFSPLRNTSRDTISFGIQTIQKSRATLLHITSHSKSLDFLRLEVVPFKVSLTCDLCCTSNISFKDT